MPEFQLVATYQPAGDQPQAISALVAGVNGGAKQQVLLGATGTGKTFSIANVIAQTRRPTLVLAHNKTLAAQLYSEFRELFPHNAVSYFVSYYDYYQPEAYIPRTDTFIEKETVINQEIERLRLAATQALATRRDAIVVASVSALYALGDPQKYNQAHVALETGQTRQRGRLLRRLVDIHYERNDFELRHGTFRVRGDTLEIQPPHADNVYRVAFWGDEVEQITEVDPLTGEIKAELSQLTLHPARHFVVPEEHFAEALVAIEVELEQTLHDMRHQNHLLAAQRLEQRTRYDLEMLRELGYCSGVENYGRHLYHRPPGSPPWTLLDYFPDDFLMIVDESHMTVPQIRAMFQGDRSRKQTLVDFGFRLPSCLDNRPLTFTEWEERAHQIIYTSATPRPYELAQASQVVEQIIRPTGLLDPQIEVRPAKGQVDDLLSMIRTRVKVGQRTLVTTLTKRMAEDLSDYLAEMGLQVQYLHSEIKTLERTEILHALRAGVYEVIVGVNLLREGLDLPEVSLVAILDADKEGFLRSDAALIQVSGRAARHASGLVIMYADRVTPSMARAIEETERRRSVQLAYNRAHGITPRTIEKALIQMLPASKRNEPVPADLHPFADHETLADRLAELETEMRAAAAGLAFEHAAHLRDQIRELQAEYA